MILTVLGFSLVASFAITLTYQNTIDKINVRILQAKKASLAAVLSQGSTAVADTLDGFGEYWIEKDENGEVIGYAFIGMAPGYSSVIKFFCGVDLDGNIKGISIISQDETPGLGSRITEKISDAWFPMGLFQDRENVTPWFSEQYVGISTMKKINLNRKSPEWHKLPKEEKEKLRKNNQVTVITGSTITVAAITDELCTRAKALAAQIAASGKRSQHSRITAAKTDEDGDEENGETESETELLKEDAL